MNLDTTNKAMITQNQKDNSTREEDKNIETSENQENNTESHVTINTIEWKTIVKNLIPSITKSEMSTM